jgi:hypothetical protein
MGDLAYVPLPPSVSPPYMTFCHLKRGFNGVNEIFEKKFWKNFWEKIGTISPIVTGGYIY